MTSRGHFRVCGPGSPSSLRGVPVTGCRTRRRHGGHCAGGLVDARHLPRHHRAMLRYSSEEMPLSRARVHASCVGDHSTSPLLAAPTASRTVSLPPRYAPPLPDATWKSRSYYYSILIDHEPNTAQCFQPVVPACGAKVAVISPRPF